MKFSAKKFIFQNCLSSSPFRLVLWGNFEKSMLWPNISTSKKTKFGAEPKFLNALYIKEKLLDENKINELLKELISMEIWRTECLPIMFQTQDFKPDTTLPIEIGLAHEINILTILENVLFHSDSLESLEDRALDLIDYCHRQLNAVISAVSVGTPEESESHQLKKNNLHIRLNEDKFRISALCLSIFFHMTNNLDAVPISAINRMLNKINLPQLLVEIVQIQPWTRDDKAFYDNAWNEIKDRRHVTKTEGMVFAILFNMIAKPEMFEKYRVVSQ